MLAAVGRKYNQFQTYRRIRSCWTEYTLAAKTGDFGQYGGKLKEFLDQFQSMYISYVANDSSNTIDKVYGDCSEILFALLDWVDKHDSGSSSTSLPDHTVRAISELFTKCLSVAELILRDDKYRQLVVSGGPTVIRQVVSLLDKVKSVESKKILLQLLSSLGERTEGRLEIARMDGFRKMLRLLVEGDDGLTRQVLRTLRHFLQAQNDPKKPLPPTPPSATTTTATLPSLASTYVGLDTIDPTASSIASSSTNTGASLSPHASLDDTPIIDIGPPVDHALEEVLGGASNAAMAAAAAVAQMTPMSGSSSVGSHTRRSISSFAKQKVTGVVYELSKLALMEFHRVFPPGTTPSSSTNPAKRGVDVAGHHRPGSGSWDPSFGSSSSSSSSSNASSSSLLSSNGVTIGVRHRRSGSSPFLPSFPPRHHDINNVLTLLQRRESSQSSEQQLAADERADDKFAASVAAAAASGGPTAAAAATVAGLGASSGKLGSGATDSVMTKSEDLLRELMRVQGALRALTDTLRQAALNVQLDLIDTIGKLLFNNRRNQREFASIDGYSFILALLDEVTDYASSKDSQNFLSSCFQIMLSMVLDGQPSKLVGNIDALRWLVHMVSHSEQTAVQLQALQCLQDLISINPLNAAYIKHVGGVDLLLTMLEAIGRQTDGAVSFSGPISGARHCIICRRAPPSSSASTDHTKRGSRSNRDYDDEKKHETKHSDPSSPAGVAEHGHGHGHGHSSHHGHTHSSSHGHGHGNSTNGRMKNPMDLRALLMRIDDLLKYMSAVLSRHDHDIASEYVRIILATHLPIGGSFQQPHPVFTSLLLRSIIHMVCHFSFFGVEIADSSVTSFVRLLHVFAKQMHAFLAAAVIAAANSSNPSPAPSPLASPTFAALHSVASSSQLSSSSSATITADSSLPSTPKRTSAHQINSFDLKEITKEEGDRVAALMAHATAAELGVSVTSKPRSRAGSSDINHLAAGGASSTAARLRDTSSPLGTASAAAITGANGHGPIARSARAQMAAAAASSLNTRLTARWIWEHVSLVLELIGCSVLLQPSVTQRRLAQVDHAHGFEAMYTLLHPRAHAPEEVTDLALYLVRRFVSVREQNRVKKLNSLWTLASGTGGPAQLAAAQVQVATPAAAAAMVGAAVVVATTATTPAVTSSASSTATVDTKQKEELAIIAAAAAAAAVKKEAARADKKSDDAKKEATVKDEKKQQDKDSRDKDGKDGTKDASTGRDSTKDGTATTSTKDGNKSERSSAESKDVTTTRVAPSTPQSHSSASSSTPATPNLTPTQPSAPIASVSVPSSPSSNSNSTNTNATSATNTANNASSSASTSAAAAAAAAEAAAVADALDEAESFCHWFVVLLEDTSVSDAVRLKILKATIILLRSPLPPLAGPHFSIKTGFREAGGVDALLAIIKTDAEHNHDGGDDDKSDSDGESDNDSVGGNGAPHGHNNNHSYSATGRSYGYGTSRTSRNGSYGANSRSNSRSGSRTGIRRPQHRVSPDVCAAAFLALAEALRGCETNKAYIGETLGFCELSELLKRTSLTLSLHVFDVMFDLATTAGPSVARLHATGGASAREPPAAVLPSPLTDMRFKQVFGTMDYCLAAQRIIERINRPAPLFVAPLSVSNEILQNLDPPSPEPPVGGGIPSSLPVDAHHRPLISTRRSRSESSLTLLVEEQEHPLHTMVSSSSSHISPMGRFPRSGSGSSDPGSNVPMPHSSPAGTSSHSNSFFRGHARSLDSIGTNDSSSDHPVLSRPESFDSDSASTHSNSSHSPVHISVPGGVVVSTSSSSINGNMNNSNGGNNGRRPSIGSSSTVFLTSTKFRSAEAAMMIVLLLPHGAPRVQQEVIKRLALLLEANPANKRALCQMNVLATLLRLCPRFHEEVQTYYLQLVATLGLYDISQREVRLLFDLAALDPDQGLRASFPPSVHHSHSVTHMNHAHGGYAHGHGLPPPHRYGSPQGRERDHGSRRARELQMQMLYVIGRITERISPPAYFNFDGVVSSLMLAPQIRFPSARYGYSVCFWLTVNTFFGHESSLLTWVDHTGVVCFELLFQLIPGNDVHARALCVRTKEGTFICTSYAFAESSQWRHITMTHNRTQLCLMVDGKMIHKFANVFYPANSVSKSTPITGHVAAPPADSVRTTSFCGAIDTLHFMEGILEEKQVAALYNEGTLFTGDPKNVGISLKRFLIVQPGEYSAEPGGTLPPAASASLAASPPDSPTLGSRVSGHDLSLMSPLFLNDSSRGGMGGTRSPPGHRSRSPMRRTAPPSSATARELAVSPVRSPINNNATQSLSPAGNTNTSSNPLSPVPLTASSSSSATTAASKDKDEKKKDGKDDSSSVAAKKDSKDTKTDGKTSGDKDATTSTKKEGKVEAKKDDTSPLHLPLSSVTEKSTAESSALANIWSLPKARAPVDVHVTRTIKDEIRSVAGSLHLCLPFMTMGISQQVAGLRILGGLLERCRPNMTEFLKSNGFELLGHVLAAADGVDISRETCEVLLDITSGSLGTPIPARTFMYPAGLLLVLDLIRLPRCDLATRRLVLDSISQIVTATSLPANLQVWRDGPAIIGLVDLSRFVPDTNHAAMALTAPTCSLPQSLSYMLESILLVGRYEELELLLQCLAADAEERSVVYERAGLCRTLTGVMATKPVLVAHLAKAGGFELLFLLLRSPANSVRADCLRMLGYLFDVNPKNAVAFAKQNYYDVLHVLLARHQPSHAVLTILIDIALGHIKCVEPPDGKSKSATSTPAAAITAAAAVASVASPSATDGDKKDGTSDEKKRQDDSKEVKKDEVKKSNSGGVDEKLNLTQPLVVRVILQLLADCDDAALHLECLAQLDVIFDRGDNMDKVLDLDWLLWARSYLQSLHGRSAAATTTTLTSSSSSSASVAPIMHHGHGHGPYGSMQRVLAKFHAILAKTVLRDLMRPYKQSKIGRAREMVEAPEFQVTVIEAVLDYFDDKPTLDKINAPHMLRNMMALYEEVESLNLPPRVCVHTINTINVIASSNDGDVRTKMQDLGVLMLRDNLVLYCIREDMSVDQRLESFRTFSFEMVSGHPKFRDSHGLLYMLKIFVECRDIRLQIVIADILRMQLGTHEENRRALTKIVVDVVILRNMFHVAADELKGGAAAICFPMLGKDDEFSVGDASDTKVSTPSRGSAPVGGLAAALPPGTIATSMMIDTGPRDDSVEEFVHWYFSDALTPRRVAIQQRLEKAFAPIEAAHRKTNTSVTLKKQKRLRARQDKLVKAQQTTTKGVNEIMERITTRILPKCVRDYGTRVTRANEQRTLRAKIGDDSWNKIQPSLRYVLPTSSTPAVPVVVPPVAPLASPVAAATSATPVTTNAGKETKDIAPKDVSKSEEKKDAPTHEKGNGGNDESTKPATDTIDQPSSSTTTDGGIIGEEPVSPGLTVNTGSPRTNANKNNRRKPRGHNKRRNGRATNATQRTVSDPHAAAGTNTNTETATDMAQSSPPVSPCEDDLPTPDVSFTRVASQSQSADDSDDAVTSHRRPPFRPALGAANEESQADESASSISASSSINDDLTTSTNGNTKDPKDMITAGEGSLNLATLKIRTSSEDELSDHRLVIPPLELPPRASPVAATTVAASSTAVANAPTMASSSVASSATPSPSSSSMNHTRQSSHSTSSNGMATSSSNGGMMNPLAELRCPHCQQMFKTQWDCICHIRLDHDHSAPLMVTTLTDVTSNTPVMTATPAATMTTPAVSSSSSSLPSTTSTMVGTSSSSSVPVGAMTNTSSINMTTAASSVTLRASTSSTNSSSSVNVTVAASPSPSSTS